MKSTQQLNREERNADAPEGYRFLIQLIGVETRAEARKEAWLMFGNEVYNKAIIKEGCNWPLPQPGFTVSIPVECVIP